MINLKTKDWQINDVETVLFDKDGTLIDLHYFWGKMTELRCNEIIKQFNLSKNALPQLCLDLGYNTNTGKMLSNGITALYSRSKIIEIFANDLLKYNIKISENELAKIFDNVSEKFYKEMFTYTKPIDSTINFVEKLKANNIKMGIVTSDSVVSTELTLKHFEWENFFETFVGRESSTETKESGALTKIALKKLNANPKKTIMIGDAPMDYISAQNADIKNTILIATGQIAIEELKKVSPFCIQNLSEISIEKIG